jgi:NTE family protein
MVRSTSALLDTAAARSLLDRPTARAVLSRFGADTWPEDANGEPSQSGEDGLDDMEGTPEVPRLGSFEVMNRTIDIAQSALARHTLAAYPPDLLIEVPRSTCRGLEFHRAVEVIAAGRALANRALDALEAEPDRSAPPPIEG